MPFLTTARRRTIMGLLGVLGGTATAQAQLYPLTQPPTTPTDLNPVSGTYEGRRAPGTVPTLAWSQYFPGPGLNLHPAATSFVVCLDAYAGAAAPPCTYDTADFRETIAAPSSALARVGNRFTFTPGRSITNAELDVPMRFTVGACSAPVNRSCSFSSADLYFSSRNITLPEAGQNQTLTTSLRWFLDARAANSGDGEIAAFSGTVKLFEVLGRGDLGRTCRNDVDALDVIGDTTLTAIDVNGLQTPVVALTRPFGTYNGPTIRGMFRMGSLFLSRNYATSGTPTLTGNLNSPRGVGVVDFGISAALPGAQARTFVLVSSVDTTNVVREYNENDNTAAQCKVR